MLDLNQHLQSSSGKILMVVFPHPDDETFGTGGLLLRAQELGWKTIVVTLTKGGAGKIFVHGRGRSVREIREEELRRATKALNVTKLIGGDFNDAQLVQDEEKWLPWLEEIIAQHKPSMLVTYDHSGLTGHPDHIILSLRLLEIVKKLKVKPEVFWVTMTGEFFGRVVDKRVADMVSEPTHILNLSLVDRFKKVQALVNYRSQFPMKKIFLLVGYILKRHTEWYHKVDFTKKYPHKFVDFKL